MQTIIACNFDICSPTQKVYVFKEDKQEMIGEIDTLNAGKLLTEIANQYCANKIHVIGPNDFLNPIIDTITEINFSTNNDIEIEVN